MGDNEGNTPICVYGYLSFFLHRRFVRRFPKRAVEKQTFVRRVYPLHMGGTIDRGPLCETFSGTFSPLLPSPSLFHISSPPTTTTNKDILYT